MLALQGDCKLRLREGKRERGEALRHYALKRNCNRKGGVPRRQRKGPGAKSTVAELPPVAVCVPDHAHTLPLPPVPALPVGPLVLGPLARRTPALVGVAGASLSKWDRGALSLSFGVPPLKQALVEIATKRPSSRPFVVPLNLHYTLPTQ